MVEVGRFLHAELAAGGEHRPQARQEPSVVVDPVDRGVRDHEVVGALHGYQVGELEAQAWPFVLRRFLEHLGGVVDTGDVGIVEGVGQAAGQLAGPTAEVDDPHAGSGHHQLHEVLEGSEPFGLEPQVLVGVPGHRAQASSAAQSRVSIVSLMCFKKAAE